MLRQQPPQCIEELSALPDEKVARSKHCRARLLLFILQQLSEWENSPPEEREDMMAQTAMDALNRWESEGLMSNLPDGLDIKSA